MITKVIYKMDGGFLDQNHKPVHLSDLIKYINKLQRTVKSTTKQLAVLEKKLKSVK